jgi:hypothetical protein
MDETEEGGEAHTLGILRELQETAEEIGHGHMHYAQRFHELLQTISNPNLPDVARNMGFRVIALQPGTSSQRRVIAVCSNASVAIAAWECACKIFPKDRWILTWGGMVTRDSMPPILGE